MITTLEHCGDTCSVVSQMASAFKEFVPKEQRMAQAIAAVQSGKMSQRAAALKFDIPRKTLGDHMKQVGETAHPATFQSEPVIKPIGNKSEPSEIASKAANSNSRLQAIRRFAAEHGVKEVDGKPAHSQGNGAIYRALTAAGIDVPEDLKPRSLLPKQPKASKPKPTTIPPKEAHDDTNEQGIYADDSLFVVTDGGGQTDSEQDHPAFAENFDLDAVRERVNHDVQQSDRPADFKRAIELLTELDRICTDAWYRRHPEPWGHDDWAHVSSEIEALHSIVGQRAEETADELLRKSSAVKVTATVID